MGGGASDFASKYNLDPLDEVKYKENFDIISRTGLQEDIILEALAKQYERDHPSVEVPGDSPSRLSVDSASPDKRNSFSMERRNSGSNLERRNSGSNLERRNSNPNINGPKYPPKPNQPATSPGPPRKSDAKDMPSSPSSEAKGSPDRKLPSYMQPQNRTSTTGDSPTSNSLVRRNSNFTSQSQVKGSGSTNASRRSSTQSPNPEKISRMNSEEMLGGIKGSIDGKPFACAACNLFFPSKLMLDRHLEVSFTHTRTLRDIEEAKKAKVLAEKKAIEDAALAAMEPVVPSTPRARKWWRKSIRWGLFEARIKLGKRKLAKRRIEIVYKKLKNFNAGRVVYQGTKVYWKNVDKESIEYSFLVHDVEETRDDKVVDDFSQVLEIVGFDTKTHSELPRLYLNYAKLTDDLKEEIEKQIAKFRQSTLFKTAGAGLSEEKVNEKITKEVISGLLHPRIELKDSTDPLLPRKHTYLSVLEHADADASVEVKDSMIRKDDSIKIINFAPYELPRPYILKYMLPGIIERPRKMSVLEIQAAMANMKREVDNLTEHTSKAETHSVGVDANNGGVSKQPSMEILSPIELPSIREGETETSPRKEAE